MTFCNTSFLSNIILDNPSTNVANMISSAGVTSMPVITASDYTWVTLGLLDTTETPEILMVPAFSVFKWD